MCSYILYIYYQYEYIYILFLHITSIAKSELYSVHSMVILCLYIHIYLSSDVYKYKPICTYIYIVNIHIDMQLLGIPTYFTHDLHLHLLITFKLLHTWIFFHIHFFVLDWLYVRLHE